MGTVTKTVGTSGRDYSTPALAFASLPSNFVTDGNSYVLDHYNDSEFSSAGNVLAVSGITTDATHTLTVKAATGQSWSDNGSVQTNRVSYIAANGVGFKCTANYVATVTCSVLYVSWSGLQLTTTGNASVFDWNQSNSSLAVQTMENCILDRNIGNGAGTNQVIRFKSGIFRNSFVIQRGDGDGVWMDYAQSGGLKYVNLTVVRPSDRTVGGTAFNSASGSTLVENCAVFGFTNFCSNNSQVTGSNNCSDLVIGFGTSNQASKTYSSQFVTTTNSTSDFKAKAGADLLNNAVTDTTYIPSVTDAVGTARPQGSAWDIGAWELVVAGIAFDAASNSGYQAASSSYSFARTITGSNTFLAVDVPLLSAGQTVTSVIDDYDGTPVNLVFIGAKSTVTSFGRIEQWGLAGAATGTKNIQINLSGAIASSALAVSYTGVHQTVPTEAFNSAQATNVGAADATVDITTIADNCWVHGAVATSDTAITANQTSRNNVTGAGGSGANEDNNTAKTPAGAVTMSFGGVDALATWAIAGYAIRPLAASGGTTYSAGVTETGTLADALTGLSAFSSAVTESATASEISAVTSVFSSAIVEAATVAEVSTAVYTAVVAAVEAASASEVSTGLPAFASDITESATASDSESVSSVFAPAIVEAATAVDTPTAIYTVGVVANEAATASEVAASTYITTGDISEAVSISEISMAGGVTSASASEATTASETSEAVDTTAAVVVEGVTSADALDATYSTPAAIPEAANATDLASAVVTFFTVVSEAAAASDSTDASIGATTYSVSVSEAATASDTVLSAVVASASVSDSASASDSISGAVVTSVSVAESTTAADSSSSGLALTVTVTDAASAADALDAATVFIGAAAEAANASDAASAQFVAFAAALAAAAASDTLVAYQIFNASILEGANASDSVAASGAYVVSTERTYHIPVQDRRYGIAPQQRIFKV